MSNIEKIRSAMLGKGINALLLTGENDRRYALGFSSSFGYVLILPEDAFFITDSRYIEAARERIRGAKVLMSTATSSAQSQLLGILEENGISEVGVQEETLSYGAYLRLEKELGVSFRPAQAITLELRVIKEKYEVEYISAAQSIAEKAFKHILGVIKEGLTEREVAAELEYHMAKSGAEGLAFDTICVAGENSSRPHGVPTGRRLRKGDFITMDFGCKIGGYCSDMTRTVALGQVTEEMRRVYDTVYEAQLAGIAAMCAGIEGRAADKAARDVIEKAGYGEFFGHGLGHCLGLDVHEEPRASTKETRLLPAGAVITCEPGIYLPGRFGVRIEDMLLITETGCINLTKAQKNLIIL